MNIKSEPSSDFLPYWAVLQCFNAVLSMVPTPFRHGVHIWGDSLGFYIVPLLQGVGLQVVGHKRTRTDTSHFIKTNFGIYLAEHSFCFKCSVIWKIFPTVQWPNFVFFKKIDCEFIIFLFRIVIFSEMRQCPHLLTLWCVTLFNASARERPGVAVGAENSHQ